MKKKKGIEQMDVAEKIRYFRQQKGLSQEQLGKRAGIHELIMWRQSVYYHVNKRFYRLL